MKGKEKEDVFCVKVIFVTNMYLCVDCPKIITSVNLDYANTYSVDSLLELNEKVPFQRDTELRKAQRIHKTLIIRIFINTSES